MDEWRDMTLGAIATQDGYGLVDGPFGSNLPASSYTDEGVPVIRGSNLSLGTSRFRAQEFVFVSHETAKRLERSICRPLDIVFTKKGTLGQTGLVPDGGKYEQYLLSSNQMKLTVDRCIADPLYVYYFVSSPKSTQKIIRDADSTGVPKTNVAYLREFPIRLPAVSKQRAIASVLGALDDKIEHNRRTAQALEKLARAIFRAWFVDFEPVKAKATGVTSFPSMPQPVFDALPTRFVDSAIGPVPEGWVVKAIGDVVTVKGGATPSTKDAEFWEGGTHCWATPKDMSRLAHPVLLDTERRITDAGVEHISSGVLPVGTVLMSSRAPVGYLAIAGVPTAINQGFIAMVCDGPLPPPFIFNWAACSMDTIKAHASGTTFAEISKRTFRPLPIVEPIPDVTAAYREQAEPLFELLTACVKESAKLAEMRDYLLPKLLSGQIRVREAERAAATVA